MDKDILNLISNSIDNDFFKMFCIDIIENVQTSKYIIYDIQIVICTYLLVNNYNYFLKKLFEGYKIKRNRFFNDLDYIYYKYLQENNLPTLKIQEKLFSKFKSKGYIKRIQKDIDKLETINISRNIALSSYKKKDEFDSDLKKYILFKNSLKIISECIKYKLLIENLNLLNNSKIDIIMKKYIKLTGKLHTVENKFYLF